MALSPRRMGRRALVEAGVFGLSWSTRLSRLIAHGQAFTNGVLDEALSQEEKALLTFRLYDESPYYRGTDLYDWEQRWWGEELPPPPAHILVGGCGAGREPLALLDRGYTVTAFEPAPGMAAAARDRCAGRCDVVCCSYQDLVAARRGGGDERTRKDTQGLLAARYDAVLLGWGSLGHVLEREQRRDVLTVLDALCPAGPLLTSFPIVVEAPSTRAYRWGARVGAVLGRRSSPAEGPEDLYPWAGYLARIDDDELTEHAASLGRAWIRQDRAGEYQHGTLRVSSPSGRRARR